MVSLRISFTRTFYNLVGLFAFLALAWCSLPTTLAKDTGVAGNKDLTGLPAVASFANLSDDPVVVYWVNEDKKTGDNLVLMEKLDPLQGTRLDTTVGYSFVYEWKGEKHTKRIEKTTEVFIVGPNHFVVECSTTAGTMKMHIMPEWSPFGAARFLDLIKMKYYDGCALNRVIPKFLTQFGISADYATRTKWRSQSITDDAPVVTIPFETGYMAYAGSGPNSRTTEVFVVMPGTSDHQLKAFGQNPWETSFGYVEKKGVEDVVSKWYAYGDMPDFGGGGPDPQLIYKKDGYDYLKKNFGSMSYIEKCEVVASEYVKDASEAEL